MEHVGFDLSVIHGTVHTEAFNHSIGTDLGKVRSIPEFQQRFHSYAIDWKSDKSIFISMMSYTSLLLFRKSSAEWPLTIHFI